MVMIYYSAPIHLKTVKRAAEADINAPSPKRESVIAVKSPMTTPATSGMTDLRP